MGHAHVKSTELFLILVDSFSEWPEIVMVQDKKTDKVKQILRVIFSRNRMLKTLVFDNAQEFHNESLYLWLE